MKMPHMMRTLSAIVCLLFTWVCYVSVFYNIKFIPVLLFVFLQTSLFPGNYGSVRIFHVFLFPRKELSYGKYLESIFNLLSYFCQKHKDVLFEPLRIELCTFILRLQYGLASLTLGLPSFSLFCTHAFSVSFSFL